MSREDDIELIRSGWEEWNRSGIDPEVIHPDCVWTDPPEMPGGGTHVGRDETVAWLENWEGTMGVVSLDFHIEEIRPLEDDRGYFVVSQAEGKGESGVPIPSHHWFHIVTIEDGMLRTATVYLDRAQALRDAGLEP